MHTLQIVWLIPFTCARAGAVWWQAKASRNSRRGRPGYHGQPAQPFCQ